MRLAIPAGVAGTGMTLASTFASALGLSVHQQRIGFAFGVFLIALGLGLYFYQHRNRPPAGSGAGDTNVNYGRQDVGINKGTYRRGGSD
jgi:hypothetical protein